MAALPYVDPEIDAFLATSDFAADPFPTYARLRQEMPVFRSETQGAWLISRYSDVRDTLRDHQRFSSHGRFSAVLDHLTPEERLEVLPLEEHFSVGMIGSDPPNHTRLRGLINRAFTPRVIESLRPRIEALVEEFLHDIIIRGTGEMEVIADFAFPLPATVIAELLGAPPESREQFREWSHGILAFQGTGRTTVEVLERSQRDLLSMRAFLTDLADERRSRPQDDLLSRMVEVEMEGDRLTSAELLTTCVTLLTAGHETTTNLIGNGIYTLLSHPEQLQLLRAEPALLPSAIEEILRFHSPLQRNPRRLATDVDLHGVTMKQGDFVLQLLGSANRDPAHFPQPNRFDIARDPNRHLAFGMGIHFCLGAPLARLEGPIAIAAMLHRMPNLHLADEQPQWLRHGLLRGFERLDVSF